MMSLDSLQRLGWRPFFQSQMVAHPGLRPARVLAIHRGRCDIADEAGYRSIDVSGGAAGLSITVGDWIVVDDESQTSAVLDRFGVFKRRSAGTEGATQLIAANVDTVFIVTSANRDFNVARLERYLAIAQDAGAFPVVVITKADTVDSVADFVSEAARLSPGLLVEAVDGRNADAVEGLRVWCDAGQTLALMGSSGVGKSTLINTLAGAEQDTQTVRRDDQRGRHTTSGRSMHSMPGGGWLIDTPGMRELQLVDVGEALDHVFVEVAALAESCRFANCTHNSEPGCAVREAIDSGELDVQRLQRYQKLLSEDRRNSESVAERRSRNRDLSKMYKSVQANGRQRKGG